MSSYSFSIFEMMGRVLGEDLGRLHPDILSNQFSNSENPVNTILLGALYSECLSAVKQALSMSGLFTNNPFPLRDLAVFPAYNELDKTVAICRSLRDLGFIVDIPDFRDPFSTRSIIITPKQDDLLAGRCIVPTRFFYRRVK